MVGRECKFQQVWTIDPLFKNWIAPVNGDSSKAWCRVCNKQFSVKNRGRSQVKDHMEGETHKKLQQSLVTIPSAKFVLAHMNEAAASQLSNSTTSTESSLQSQAVTKESVSDRLSTQDSNSNEPSSQDSASGNSESLASQDSNSNEPSSRESILGNSDSLTVDGGSDIEIIGIFPDNNWSPLSPANKQFELKKKVSKAEVLIILDTLANHQSLCSMDHKGDLFRMCFGDSEVAHKFQCARTKASYIIRFGISPYIFENATDAINESDIFTISFDESLNTKLNTKQLDIHVRRWVQDVEVVKTLGVYF